MIIYKTSFNNKLSDYIIEFLCETAGFCCKKAGTTDSPNLFYGPSENRDKDFSGVDINYASNYCFTPITEQDISKNVHQLTYESSITFDIIKAVGFFLTDECHKNASDSDYDAYQRIKFDCSFQKRNNIETYPIVNLYVNFFRNFIHKKLKLTPTPLFPNGKGSAIILSHDVDHPDKYAVIRNITLRPNSKWIPYLLKVGRVGIDYLLDKNPNDFWLFEDVARSENKFGFTSTFFFATEHFNSPYGDPIDVRYNIQNKIFQSAFKTIKQYNSEIGLHAAYNTYQSGDRFINEKKKLEQICNTEIHGLRHHFWHTGKDHVKVALMHEQAGLKYDSSLGFNEHIGFRYNVALPFNLFDAKNKRKIDVLQIPSFCMDGNLMARVVENVPKAVQTAKEYIDSVQRNNGIAAIDWHVRTSFPKNKEYYNWGSVYQEILYYLAQQENIWVTNFKTAYEWFMQRKKMIEENGKDYLRNT